MTLGERSFNEVRVGRYALELPAELVREGQEYTFTHITLEERDMPAPPDGLAELWARKIADVRALPLPPALPLGQAGNIVEEREVEPGLRQVVYCSSEYSAKRVKLFALFDPSAAGGSVATASSVPVLLTLELDGFIDIIAEMTRMAAQTARKYRPPRADLLPGSPPPDPPRFYLERGSIAIPYLRRELAMVTFEDRTSEQRSTLQVNTGASGATHDPSLIESVKGFMATMRGELDMRSLGSGYREVAGARGEEVRTRSETPGEHGFFFGYTHPEDGSHPELSLRLMPSGDDLAENVAVWDRILSSVKRIG